MPSWKLKHKRLEKRNISISLCAKYHYFSLWWFLIVLFTRITPPNSENSNAILHFESDRHYQWDVVFSFTSDRDPFQSMWAGLRTKIRMSNMKGCARCASSENFPMKSPGNQIKDTMRCFSQEKANNEMLRADYSDSDHMFEVFD